MKRLALGLSTSLLLLCAPAAQAAVITYSATLSGLNEDPQNNSPATGRTTVMIDDVSGMMTVNAIFSGLTGTTTASHIHCCTAIPGVGTIGVATSLPTFPAFPLGVTSGNYSESFDLLNAATYSAAFITRSGGTVEGARTALLAGMAAGRSYLNIHTTAFLPARSGASSSPTCRSRAASRCSALVRSGWPPWGVGGRPPRLER